LGLRPPARRAGTTAHTTAIDLGAAAVRVVELEGLGGKEGMRVLRRGTAPLPPHAWSNLAAHHDAFAEALRVALSGAGIASKTVVACLPRRLVTLRFAQLPAGTPEQMRGMVDFEAQQYIPFPRDEVVLDYHVLAEPAAGLAAAEGDNLETVLIAAARRTLITEVLAIFDRAGLELCRLSVSALALAENIRDALEPTALIDLKPGEMDAVVVANGRLLFTRAAAFALAGRDAESVRVRMAEEVVRSFTAYQNEFRHHPLVHVYLSGVSAVGPEAEALQRALSEMLEMPVARFQSRLLPPGDPDAPAYATAIGMALQGAGVGLAPINLVPDERAERRALERRRKARIAVGLAAVGLLAVFGIMFSRSLAAQRELKERTQTANAKLSDVQARLDARQRSYNRLQAQEAALASALDRNHPTVDVLAAVNMALPKSTDIWLTQFEFDRGGLLTLRGNTRSALAATDLVIRLQQSGAFSEVRIGYLGDAQEEKTPASRPTTKAPGESATGSPASAATTTLPGMPGAPAPPGIHPGTPAGTPAGTPVPGSPPPNAAPASPPPGTLPNAAPAGPGSPGPAPGGPALQARGHSAPETRGPTLGGKPPAPHVKKSAPAPKKGTVPARPPLTSFVITCRLNPGAPSLLTGAPAPTGEKPTESALAQTGKRTAAVPGANHAPSP